MTATEKQYDIIVVGSGPIGLAFALSAAKLGLTIAIIDKQSVEQFKKQKSDGREIALTHYSLSILENLGALETISKKEIFQIKEARVLDGNESNFLQFGGNSSDKLAALISNHLIKTALYKKTTQTANIQTYYEAEITNINRRDFHVDVTLESMQKITAKLIVAADSRFSQIRKHFGINCLNKDIHKTMLVARISHSLPHNNIAYECFKYGKTIALLPLSQKLCSAVITATHATAEKLMNLPTVAIEKYIEKNIGLHLGSIKIQNKFHAYPLVCTYAEKFIGDKLALLGDAAVGMHPVTAHGMNFGLKGQAMLAEEIANALKSDLPINSDFVLAAYQRRQIKLTKAFFHFTNALATIYTSESNPAKFARSILIKLANRITPIKKMLTEKLH
jgi:ubiquinone biosynthesis UbiH/UbiF/VisC/COQ6 family hydroxylase